MGRKKTTVSERLKKITFDHKKIESMASLGMTDNQIASILGVDERTIANWKKDEVFISSLKKGKEIADSKVIESLYRRATGYTHRAVKIFLPAGSREPVYAEYEEHYPPDPVSMIFWLKNRQKEHWKDRQEIDHSGTLTQKTLVILDDNG